MNIFEKADLYKNEIDKLRPFDSFMLEELKSYYRIDLTWSSNALEGNTLSLSETKIVLEDGLTVGGKPLKDYYEASGHSRAYDFMFNVIKTNKIEESYIKELHRLFYNAIDENEAGKYRTRPVIITGSKHPVCPPGDIGKQMEELALWIIKNRNNYHPIEFAALLHKKFVFIHPFIDGNGRVARLLLNTALLQDGYLLAIIPPVLRREYIDALEQAHINDTNFCNFICERVVETQKDYARLFNIPLIRENSSVDRER